MAAGAASITVTEAPSRRALDATSSPISPPPITLTLAPARSAARSRSASASVRSGWTFAKPASAGSITGREPVAISRSS